MNHQAARGVLVYALLSLFSIFFQSVIEGVAIPIYS